MLAQMEKALGWGEPNPVHRWYGSRNGSYFALGSTPWCQMTITWAAHLSGNYAAVCPHGDRAYTVWSAEDGERLGRWHAGTVANILRHAKPGAIVYMDWGGSNDPDAVDHVGIVEQVLGDGRVQTIEGNTGNQCKRRVRGAGDIAGFWNPPYEEDDMTRDEIYKAAWETDTMPVPYATEANPTWKPRSVLVDHGVKLRQILAQLDAQNATIRELVAVLAQRDDEIDVEALVARIRSEIEQVTIRLDVADA